MLQCGVRDVMGKSKIIVLSSILLAAVAVFFLWSQRFVDLKIAGVTFRVPNPAIVSASAMRSSSGDLDGTQGAFLDLPNGPYYGKWAILLQSSKERKAKGFPSPFDAVAGGKSKGALEKTAFGWCKCAESCGRDTWYFSRAPLADDSVYSVSSIVCHKTEICELLFSYGDVDVSVSLQQSKVADGSKAMEQAVALLSSFAVAGK
jgi:hypothetical protein